MEAWNHHYCGEKRRAMAITTLSVWPGLELWAPSCWAGFFGCVMKAGRGHPIRLWEKLVPAADTLAYLWKCSHCTPNRCLVSDRFDLVLVGISLSVQEGSIQQHCPYMKAWSGSEISNDLWADTALLLLLRLLLCFCFLKASSVPQSPGRF